MYKKLILVLLTVVFLANGYASDIYGNCGESIKCIEDNLIKIVDDFDSKSSVSLWSDCLVLEKTNEETFLPRSEEGIVERILRYVSNHEIRIRLPSETNARQMVEETRKRKGILRKLILPFLILLKLKAIVLIPAILFVTALAAFKGLFKGFLALVISGVVAMKSLFEKHGSSSFSYEIVPQIPSPHWSRNGMVAGAEGWSGLVPGYQTIPK